MKDFFASFRLILNSCLDLFVVRFLMGFAVIIYRSNFSLLLQETFEITPKTIGQIMSFGAVVGFVSGMCAGRVVKFYGSLTRLLMHSSIAQVFTICGLTFATNLPMFLFFTTCLSIENSINRVCITDLSVKRSNVSNTGALLGLSSSLMSMARAIAPFIAGLTQEVSHKGPGLIGVVSAALGCLCIITTLKNDDPQEQKTK